MCQILCNTAAGRCRHPRRAISSNSCPPGTAPSPITRIGTCHNPTDARDYIVSFNDCCGKASCGNCQCNRNEREKPMYRPSRNNDLNWCMANADANYHCSVSVILAALAEVLNFVVFDLAHASDDTKPLSAAEIASERSHPADGAAVRAHRVTVIAALRL